MCSTPSAIASNLCVSAKSTPFRPMRAPKQMQCWIHPRRVNCKAVRLRSGDNADGDDLLHTTVLCSYYLNERAKPYYRQLLRDSTDQAHARKTILNAESMYECVFVKLVHTEQFKGIEEAGESNMNVLKIIINSLIQYLSKLGGDEYFLVVDKMYVDLVYSEFRTIIMPQSAYIIKGSSREDANGSDSDENSECDKTPQPWSVITTNNYLASTDESRQSQYIYRTFLLYNTILTAVLKQSNPFDANATISIICRNLGRCPNNKERIKCCDLNYGGTPPGHVMCPPREITKKVFHYAKWSRNPNKYRRYSELIVRHSEATGGRSGDLRENIANELHARDRAQLQLLDWQNFMGEFSSYFGLRT
ncbi:vp1054 [Cyclophragma undans nucleopolyhedrovirus]|uniref:Vp1054 n=1 Tax=Cyclophragma undans nucleopolyhedrovirus TaxID=1906244 RepID=A0A288QAB0_9ABAC|nr:vp1054 [Cyclophragma undans nucleopolyhedrovirus]AOT85555.1 vp1054 [Cyclophragma undans nucleopolyhedrovirus]